MNLVIIIVQKIILLIKKIFSTPDDGGSDRLPINSYATLCFYSNKTNSVMPRHSVVIHYPIELQKM